MKMESSGILVGVYCSGTKVLALQKEHSSRAALGFETLLMIWGLLVDWVKTNQSYYCYLLRF